ncbi:MAG: DUF1572 family protein [Planctomycetaceae bacterium]
MTTDVNEFATAVTDEAADELGDALKKVRHCCDQLTAEQLWTQPCDGLNSIANLVLHLCGNLRQWIVSGIGGAPDVRDRPREFSARGSLSKTELLDKLATTVAEAQAALHAAPADELLRSRRIQGFEVSGVRAMFESVAHFRGHTQEIVHITRTLLGDDYRFDFVPQTPEQGAPAG